MGSAGHAFISHTKALSPPAQNDGAGYGKPPHPVSVRSGQRYFTRRGKRRVGFVVRRVAGETVLAVSDDDDRKPMKVKLERLLARRDDDQGSYYQFIGYRSRSYETYAYVHAIDDEDAVLCFPEWHPRRPVVYFPALIPEESRTPGSWLSLRCDLSAASGARLQPNTIAPAADPGPDVVARPHLSES